jgi:hypothetical protein
MPRLQIQRDHGNSRPGSDEFDAKILDERDVLPKGGRLAHRKP